jgi:BMFP domain-containing protein YqiC
MLDDMKRYVKAGLEALAPQGADEVGGALLARAQEFAAQMSTLAGAFVQWSAEARASILHEVRDLVARQIEEMGVATKHDVDTLRKRLDRLEARATESKPSASTRSSATPGKTARSRSSAGKAPAKSATARPQAPKPSARSSAKSSGTGSPAKRASRARGSGSGRGSPGTGAGTE